MTVDLDRMTNATRLQLCRDIDEYGDLVERFSVKDIGKLMKHSKRAERMSKWVLEYNDGLRPKYPPKSPPETPGGPARGKWIMAVGDTHAEPDVPLAHFAWLGRMAACLLQPGDEIIWIGDHYPLTGIGYFQTKLGAENERYLRDKAAGDQALALFEREYAKAGGAEGVKRVLTIGNHEDRIERFVQDNPYLKGVFKLFERFEHHGWHVIPYMEPYRTDGWRFQHKFINHSGRTVSSTTGNARAVLNQVKYAESCVFGHSHTKSYWEAGSTVGGRKRAINIGCYFQHTEEYAGADSNDNWWRGVIVMKDVLDGDCDVIEYRMETIRNFWG